MNRQLRRREARQKSKESGAAQSQGGDLTASIQAIEALFQRGRLEEAADATLAAIEQNGPRHELYRCLGVVRQAQERFPEAIDAYNKVIEIAPNLLPAYVNLGICAREVKDPEMAIEALDKAVKIERASLHARYNRALAYCDVKRLDDAVADLKAAIKIKPDFADAHFQLAFLLEMLEDYEGAVQHYGQAALHNPMSSEIELKFGGCLQVMGRFEDAAVHLKKAIGIRPASGRAHYMLAYSDQAQFDDETRNKLTGLAHNATLPADDRIDLNFAAAKLHEKAGEYDTAFMHYETGNQIRRQGLSFDHENVRTTTERICANLDGDFLARHAGNGHDSEQPVFVIGMPRSGTTLVEQIIASHPDALGAGELSNMERLLAATAALLGSESSDAEVVSTWETETFGEIAEAYLGEYPAAARSARRVVDKTPGNSFLLGILAVMFPKARFIHIDRNAMDTSWSIYSQNFLTPVQYACDFEDIAVFYHAHQAVMAHWRALFGERILDVRYEDLIAEPEAQSRRLIDYCGLEWDERCLRPHETERGVHTASLWQVRKPIFDTSIGRWRAYEAHLQPLRAALAHEGLTGA